MLASRAEGARGHHVIAGRPAEPQARSSPQPARDGAKRSGVTEPRTAEQSGLVMAALVNDGNAQRENERDERDAQGWETVRR